MKSVGDCPEFFIVAEKLEGQLYHVDLDRTRDEKHLRKLDEDRCPALVDARATRLRLSVLIEKVNSFIRE